MHDAADRTELCEERHEAVAAIVSDLISLAEHVQASIDLIETAIARESLSDEDMANVVVLDDITPQYVKASHALNTCRTSVGTAIRFLFDAGYDTAASARGSIRLQACG